MLVNQVNAAIIQTQCKKKANIANQRWAYFFVIGESVEIHSNALLHHRVFSHNDEPFSTDGLTDLGKLFRADLDKCLK